MADDVNQTPKGGTPSPGGDTSPGEPPPTKPGGEKTVYGRSSTTQTLARTAPVPGLKPKDPLSTTWDQLGNIDRLGPYKLIKPIGRGGMGTVFLAEDTNLHRQVAVKTLLPKLARDSVAKERFLREGRLASLIKSNYVVVIHSVGEEGGIPYLAMEYLKGFSLE